MNARLRSGCLALALLLAGPRPAARAWGAWAHEHINRGAVLSLPEPLRTFFYNHADFMTEESVMPDVRKNLLNDKAEFPRHSIFLESYGPDALRSLPRTWTEAQQRFSPETLAKNGTLPWTIEDLTDKLTEAFRRRDKGMILFLAASLGHYIGDAQVPLHTTSNNNGQFTGQMDIHPLFEGQLVEMFGPGYDLNAGPAPYFADLTGTTWRMIAATHAADLYRHKQISKIIITRPNVPCGRSLGFFPGSLKDKFAPWASPIVEAIKERMGSAAFEIALKNENIEMVPFEVMRGRSWKDAFVILDEAQNTTPAEIKTFLTRVGEDCTVVINGDVSQCDLPEASGLKTVLHLIRSNDLPVPVIEFTLADIVRSGLCAMWVKAFEAARI